MICLHNTKLISFTSNPLLSVGFIISAFLPRVLPVHKSEFITVHKPSNSTISSVHKLGKDKIESVIVMAKFCANLAFMFTERPLLERYKLAKDAGFKAVETGFPFGFNVQEVSEAKEKASIQQILINVYTGDVTKGELGFAAIPGKEKEFRDSIEKTLTFAKELGCKKIHIMSGKVNTEVTTNHDLVYENNLRYAVKIFEENDIIGLIEPINRYSVPNYYMNCYDKALKIIKDINSPNLKIMLDIFHLQQIKGDVTHTIQNLLPYVGHVQIAQVPNRNEPDTPGELNYPYIFSLLRESGYNDWIGLEYKPANNTKDGLKWMKNSEFSI